MSADRPAVSPPLAARRRVDRNGPGWPDDEPGVNAGPNTASRQRGINAPHDIGSERLSKREYDHDPKTMHWQGAGRTAMADAGSHTARKPLLRRIVYAATGPEKVHKSIPRGPWSRCQCLSIVGIVAVINSTYPDCPDFARWWLVLIRPVTAMVTM